MGTRSRALFLHASVACAALTAATAAHAQQRTFDLAAQDARDSIPEFARQADIQIAAPTAQLQGLRTHAVKGFLDEQAALKLLLTGTGLAVVSDNGDMVVLRKVAEQTARLIPLSSRPGDGPASSPADPPAARPTAPSQLEEVVVTAQRRSEVLQDVPVAVVAVRAEDLQAKGVTSIQTLSQLTPGLVGIMADGFALPHIRGIGTTSDTNGVSSPVAVYVDGVYIDSPTASVFSMNNIDQIEVDKGPQGTLFGRNATGGVIQVTTKTPSQIFGGKMALGVDNYDTIVADLYLTGGLAENLAADLAVHYSDQLDGWGKNNYNGKDVYLGKETDIRTKLLWTPTDRDNITLSFDYENMNDNYSVLDYAIGAVPYDYGLSGIQVRTSNPWDTDQAIQQSHDMTGYGLSAKVQHEFDFATLTSISAWRRSKSSNVFTFSLPPFNIDGLDAGRYRQVTQEFQLSSPTQSRIKWTAGAFYMHGTSADAPYIIGQNGTAFIPGGAFAFPALPPGIAPQFGPDAFGTVTTSKQTTDSGALYGQATAEIFHQTNLTVGARYTIEHASIYGVDPALGPIASHGASFSAPTWRLALDHHFNDDFMAYVSYNRGFKAGTFDDNTAAIAATKPETLDAYEVGVKSEQFDRRLRINASAFFYSYTNIVEPLAVTVNNRPVLETTNGPKAQLYGLDLDMAGQVTDRLRVSLSLEALHSEFTSYPGATFYEPLPTGGTQAVYKSATGNQLPVAPTFTSDLTVSYKLPTSIGDFDFTGSWDHNSGWFDSPDNIFKQRAFEMVSCQITWRPVDSRWRLYVWGRNLSNAVVYSRTISSAPFGYLESLQAPRTFGVRIERDF